MGRTTRDLITFVAEGFDDHWCLGTHDRHAALAAMRALSEPISPWAPTEECLPDFVAVWVTTSENEYGELQLTPVPAGTPGAQPAITWQP